MSLNPFPILCGTKKDRWCAAGALGEVEEAAREKGGLTRQANSPKKSEEALSCALLRGLRSAVQRFITIAIA